MDMQKFSLATLIGAVVLFLVGALFYAVIFADFFQGQAGAGASMMRAEPVLWSIFIGNIGFAALLTTVFMRWATISTPVTGLKAGAIIGALAAVGYNMIGFGTTTMMSMMGGLVDVLISAVHMGIGGAAIGWFLGRK